MSMPSITLWFLQASRSIRTAWLLEELGVDYNVEFTERENNKAPQWFKDKAGDALGKFPLLTDGNVRVAESGAIAEYLCETYDTAHRLLPIDPKARYECLRWVHAAEATYALHALAILYVKWGGEGHEEAQKKIVGSMSNNVLNDVSFLEQSLKKSGTKFLCGDHVTVADTMMQFSVSFLMARELGTKISDWPETQRWLEDCESTETYQKAVKRTGHKL